MSTVKELIIDCLAERPMTVEELTKRTGCEARSVSKTLQRMSKNWEVKLDLTARKPKPWKLTAKPQPNTRWAFKELLNAWR